MLSTIARARLNRFKEAKLELQQKITQNLSVTMIDKKMVYHLSIHHFFDIYIFLIYK